MRKSQSIAVADRSQEHLSGIYGRGDRVIDVLVGIILTLIVVFTLYPLIYVVSCSFSSPEAVLTGKVLLLPIRPTLMSYQKVFQEGTLNQGILNSVFQTVVGTAVNLLVTTTGAYALSEKTLAGRKFFTKMIMFTMMFSGGLIPTYLVVRELHLLNTHWSVILPSAVSVTNFMIMKNTFQNSIPNEIKEAAYVEGASQITTFLRIVVPLSMPIIAVMLLYDSVGRWNEYFNALLYITNEKLQPLQVVLRKVLVANEVNEMMSDGHTMNSNDRLALAEGIRYAIIVISSLPMIAIYPFFQRFFAKGVMVGAVKG